MVQALRALAASALDSRARLARAIGQTFGGKRDLNETLGYKGPLGIEDYRTRFLRNAVAHRIILAAPKATWRGGGELIEDDSKPEQTPFEKEFEVLAKRLKLWRNWMKADILAGFGQYSGILIGAPGALSSPLTRVKGSDEIVFMKPLMQDRLLVESVVESSNDPRFGQPLTYKLSFPRSNFGATTQKVVPFTGDKIVHWTRIIHIAEDIEDDTYSVPRLECCWNLLDDLEKVTGGGAEAFWLRANQGLHFDLDKEIELDEPGERDLDDEVDKFMHRMQRYFRSRGMKVTTLGSDVANFQGPVAAIVQQ